MIRALLKKLRGVSKKRNLVDAPVPLEISNDEMVTAYEYVVWAHGVEFPLMALAPWHADEVHGPCEVTATLRKLGAA